MGTHARSPQQHSYATRRTRVLAAAAAAGTLVLAACSSSHGGANSGSSAPGSASAPQNNAQGTAIAKAKAEYAKYLRPQAPISIPKLPSSPPRGLSFTVVTCPLPVCHAETDPSVEAAGKLGWKVKALSLDLTPAGYQSTMNQLVADPPDLAAIIALVPNSEVSRQLAALQKAGTKIVEIAPAGDRPSPSGPVEATVVGAPHLATSGRLMADAIVANDGAGQRTAFVADPTLSTTYNAEINAFKSVIEGAGGSVDMVNISQLNVGKSVPGQVVSYVQSHPGVKYIAFTFADYAQGVAQALKVAGLAGKVRLVSRAPQQANLAAVANGDEFAEIGEENSAGGYRVVDQLARLKMNVPLGDLAEPAGWHQIYVKSNVPSKSITPGSPSAFYAAWRLP